MFSLKIGVVFNNIMYLLWQGQILVFCTGFFFSSPVGVRWGGGGGGSTEVTFSIVKGVGDMLKPMNPFYI